MKASQKDKSVLHNLAVILGIIVSVAVIVLAVLQIFHIWDGAVNVFVPLLGLNQLGQAYTQWNTNRKIACFNIGTALFVLLCTIVVFFVR